MPDVIIFGNRDFAQLAYYYLKEENKHKVVAFCVHRQYISGEHECCGLPMVSFEEVENKFPPEEFLFFAPMSHSNRNLDRERIFKAIKEKGYSFISYIHPSSTVSQNVEIGYNCMILENNTLQPFVTVADNVIIWGGNFIAHHSEIKHSSFIACGATVGGHCKIGERSFLGNSCSIRDQLHIAADSFIGMGGNVVKGTQSGLTYTGNPAKPE